MTKPSSRTSPQLALRLLSDVSVPSASHTANREFQAKSKPPSEVAPINGFAATAEDQAIYKRISENYFQSLRKG